MAYIDITPVMTSDNTPTPYIVSASDTLSGTTVFGAFDNSNTDSCWHSASAATHWVKIDFGKEVTVDAFSIQSTPTVTAAPREFKLYGSNDDITYTELGSYNETSWTSNQEKRFDLSNRINYRYFKIEIASDNGYNYTVIKQIRYLYNDSIGKIKFHKCLESNVPNTVTPGTEKVIFTDQGNLYIYKKTGEKMKVGGSSGGNTNFIDVEW